MIFHADEHYARRTERLIAMEGWNGRAQKKHAHTTRPMAALPLVVFLEVRYAVHGFGESNLQAVRSARLNQCGT
jgi:hypothetical protein